MKSKATQNQDHIDQLEDIDESEIDIQPIGPSITTGKKGKLVLILASAFIITFVIYIFFFSSEENPEQNIEPVFIASPENVAKSETGLSPFELEEGYDLIGQEEASGQIEAPPVPEIPTLPGMPGEDTESEISKIINEAEIEKEQQKAQEEYVKKEAKEEEPKNELLNILKPKLVATNIEKNAQKPVAPTKSEFAPLPIRSLQSMNKDSKIMANLNPRYSPIVVFSGSAQGVPDRSVGYEKNIVSLKENTLSDLKESKTEVKTTIISDRENTIAQGKLLYAVLETAINTEIPGFVRAIISRDVYGESGNNVLIPRGSRLFGSYSSEVKRGQGRVNIQWTRLIRPDGVDLAIDFNAADQFGRAGIDGDVDNKYQSAITNSILTSILTVGGVALAEKILGNNNDQSTTTLDPTTGTSTTTGSASNQAIYDVSKTVIDTVGTMLKNQVNTDPLITVPQGSKIIVIVNSDINVPDLIK